jgi:hypothetical protein
MRRLPIALLLCLLAGAGPAEAAFPGANGALVVHRRDLAPGRVPYPTPTPVPPPNDSGLYLMASAGEVPQEIVAMESGAAPAFAPDGRTLMYDIPGGLCFLVLGVSDPSCPLQTRDGTDFGGPDWSPDVRRIVYQTTKSQDASGYIGPDLYVMNVDGSDRHKIVDGHTASAAAWSPDGTRIAFTGTATTDGSYPADIYTVAPDGSGMTNVTNTPATSERAPDWAPDSSRIVYQTADNELRTIAADGTDDRHLGDGWAPAYSPDGTQVVATVYEPMTLQSHLVTIPAAGGEPTTILTSTDFSDGGVTWGRVPDPLPTPTPTPTFTPSPPADDWVPIHASRLGTWKRVTKHVTPRTRKVKIRFTTPACFVGTHVDVRRRAHAVVVAVRYDVLLGDSYHAIACTVPVRVTRKVSLRGRLGHRAIKDGGTVPPRVRYPAP